MDFLPLDRMWERVRVERDESDVALFNALLYLGELVVKFVVVGLVAAMEDTSGDKYRQCYRLVRANGLGDWTQVLDDVLTGPASQRLVAEAQTERQELTQRHGSGVWQYTAVKELYDTLDAFGLSHDPMPGKVQARRWVEQFVYLRNKTRGHGAYSSFFYVRANEQLESSLKLFVNNFRLFRRAWAYLQRSSSGKYAVTQFSPFTEPFVHLRTQEAIDNKVTLSDGVYVDFGGPAEVQLLRFDPATLDFYLPNGGSKSGKFEMLSYVTGQIRLEDLSPYMAPPAELPPSETQGINYLDVQGPDCFGNLPPVPRGYVNRVKLEDELARYLSDDFRRVITLEGRGGIGKTSLALQVLHDIASTPRFGFILWFSARDVDLLPGKPLQVKPQVLTVEDVADQMRTLLPPPNANFERLQATDYFASSLGKSPHDGMPILFVFDNFETVSSPHDLYRWLDDYVRAPNKVLITTRASGFNGDYSVEVGGMSVEECDRLIDETVAQLGIETPLSNQYRRDLFTESAGHPYVIKVLLGEVKRTGQTRKVERIMASRDDILEALFERTFASLSSDAQRVFLTLCGWRSAVARLALQAVLLCSKLDHRIDVESAVAELRQYSLVEVILFGEEKAEFLSIPLITTLFGEKVLKVSPWKPEIDEDVRVLRCFGAAQPSDFRHGLAPRIDAFFRELEVLASLGSQELGEYLPVLEFVARGYPPTWRRLAHFYEQSHELEFAKRALRSYLQALNSVDAKSDQQKAWEWLAALCRRTDDWAGMIQAYVSVCQIPSIPFIAISNAAFSMILSAKDPRRYEGDHWRLAVERIVEEMSRRIDAEGDARDCSRLAWLFMYLHDESQAQRITKMGLSRDPNDEHCLKLAQRLHMI